MTEPSQDRGRPGRARRLVALLGAALVLLVVLAGTNTLRNKAGIAITDDTPAEAVFQFPGVATIGSAWLTTSPGKIGGIVLLIIWTSAPCARQSRSSCAT